MDDWLKLLQAAAEEDIEGCREWSLKLGYLTGEESEVRFAIPLFFFLLAAPSPMGLTFGLLNSFLAERLCSPPISNP